MDRHLVLIVEADPSIRECLAIALRDDGYDVVQARHGAEALDLVGQQPPDVILLDTRMPVMDGWQFLQAYRRLTVPQAPVIALSADDQSIEADLIVAKPFDLDELLAVTRRYASADHQFHPSRIARCQSGDQG